MTDDSPPLVPDPKESEDLALRQLEEITFRLAHARALHNAGFTRELEILREWLGRPPSRAKH
jgi:hypothetical protein